MSDLSIGLWSIPLAVLAGAIRVGTPLLFVSIGECLTEKSGRINLGLEGTLVLGAMSGYATAFHTQSPWFGVLIAGLTGAVFTAVHGWVCKLPRVNDIAVGIAMMLLGLGLAFFFGKPYIQPSAPLLPSIPLGFWSSSPQIQSALQVNALFAVGVALAGIMTWIFRSTRIGLVIRTCGDSADAARAMGYSVDAVRFFATTGGGFLAGIGGAYLSLYYPGSWNERISSGQGLMAVALVIFARWQPLSCLVAALLFGGAGALGPALQAVGVSEGYYLFYAAPYLLTLLVMVVTVRPGRRLTGAPSELSVTK
jgi:simple sugar transport system permease protein